MKPKCATCVKRVKNNRIYVDGDSNQLEYISVDVIAEDPTEHLTPEARKHLEIFVKSSRKLLQQHNIGIYEKKK